MNSDIRQVTFFGTSYGLVDRIVTLASALCVSFASTMMAQFGVNKERVNQLAVLGAKYILLLTLPVLLGVACISGPFIRLAYGKAYWPMIPVLAITALMAIPKLLTTGTTPLLQTTERQAFLIWLGCVCGALDIGLDFLLTPHYGAVGATVANGIAQAAAAFAALTYARRLLGLDMRVGEFARIAVSGVGMGAIVLLVSRMTGGLPGLILAVVTGAAVWLGMLRLTRAITPDDRDRLLHVVRLLPSRLQPGMRRCVAVLAGRH
jgi:O-antigen/teichoic acid export membrane protein